MAEFTLGKTYRDAITGVIGVATAICSYIDETQQVQLQPQSVDGREAPKSIWCNLKFLQEPVEQSGEPTGESTDDVAGM